MRRPVQVSQEVSAEDQPETMLGDLPEHLNTGIYEIRNIKNGRRYIGSAVNVSKRWRQHLRQLETGRHHSQFMQRCWNKNGAENFIFRVVLSCEAEDLIESEQRLIDEIKPEYNCSPTASSMLGYRHREESKKKMSKARAGKSSAMAGRNHSDAAKLKISKSKTGTKYGAYSRDRVEKTAAAMRKAKSSMTEDKVRLVRELRRQGKTYTRIADQIGCTWYVVADIIQGRTFSWVK
jgi:group I intron endonuclease